MGIQSPLTDEEVRAMPRWSVWLLAASAVTVALYIGVAVMMRSPVYARAVGTPQACDTCHVMQPEITAHAGSAHSGQLCFDCHAALGFWERPLDQIRTAAAWVQATVMRTEPDVVHLFSRHRQLVADNCMRCHDRQTAGLAAGTHGAGGAPAAPGPARAAPRLCTDCHWQAAHNPVLVIRGRKEVTAP